MVNIKRIKLDLILFVTDVYLGKAYINKLKKKIHYNFINLAKSRHIFRHMLSIINFSYKMS